MKRTLIFCLLLMISFAAFCERITVRTGGLFGTTITDRFFPPDYNSLSPSCSITAVRRVEKDLWCVKILAAKTANAATYPAEYEYYLKPGDKIPMRRIGPAGIQDCTLKAIAFDWNTATFEVE